MSAAPGSDAGKRRALLVGATGLVGSHLLRQLAGSKDYRAIATLGRRAPDFRHERVTHHIADLTGDLDTSAVPRADVLFCCLGTTIKKARTEAAFRALDFDLVVSLAKSAASNGTSTFVVVSSVGADPGSRSFYLQIKGEMEQTVSELGFERLGIMRPSYLLGAREEFRPSERLGQIAFRVIEPVLFGGLAKYRSVDAATVAAAMIGFDLSKFLGKHVFEGNEIRRLASA